MIDVQILVYFSFTLSIIVLILSYVVAVQNSNAEKVSAYECGFEPFDDARNKFDIRFYLIAILFIIFDLEISYLFPWVLTLDVIGWVGFFWMGFFLVLLTFGFIYEWKKGALEWN